MTMLDLKFVRENTDKVLQMLKNRHNDLTNLDEFKKLDQERRELLQKVEADKTPRRRSWRCASSVPRSPKWIKN